MAQGDSPRRTSLVVPIVLMPDELAPLPEQRRGSMLSHIAGRLC